ncbi:MAG: glycosyltransferase family 2 protein [Chitinophagaceae bacterium]|nr:glycosyltransferase family 2 protein [Chitinophagaceae bacterium]
MDSPLVSVILPAYNSERFLHKAIESILNQAYRNFELLLINDGSTDSTRQIMQSYSDERVRIIDNPGNKGLVYSFNTGIEQAKGKYIARMDADDISYPERFAAQVDWLERNSSTSIVAAYIEFIDEEDKPAGIWPLDRKVNTYKEIRHMLPRENCIAHPTVMGRAGIFRQFRYMPYQKTEDYDLWLRIANADLVIEKIPQVLLKYRVHQSSYTSSKLRKRNNPSWQVFMGKYRFVIYELKEANFNSFILQVIFYSIKDIITASWKEIKFLLKLNRSQP